MKKLFMEYGNRNEREVNFLPKEEIEKIVDDLDVIDIYKKAYKEADGYIFSGTAYVCLDVSDGEIYTKWLQQNNFTVNNFTEVVLLKMDTPIYIDNDENLLDQSGAEWQEWKEYDGNIEDFITEKYGEDEFEERKINVIEYWATESDLEYDDIYEQIDKIYEDAIEDDEEF